MQNFSQDGCASREILLTTVYHHKHSRTSALEQQEFSFLMETLPSKQTEGDESVEDQIQRLSTMGDAILQSMNDLDEKIKLQLAKRGRIQYQKLHDRPFPSTNQSTQYKRSMGNPTEFSEIERQASVFEVDQNNNFLKYRQKTAFRYGKSLTKSHVLYQQSQSKTKPKPAPHSKKKRVYQSVLSRFTTANLLKMNETQQ